MKRVDAVNDSGQQLTVNMHYFAAKFFANKQAQLCAKRNHDKHQFRKKKKV